MRFVQKDIQFIYQIWDFFSTNDLEMQIKSQLPKHTNESKYYRDIAKYYIVFKVALD